MRELIWSLRLAILATLASGCVPSSYVRQRSRDIRELSQEVSVDVEECKQVYPRLSNATHAISALEPCQRPGCVDPDVTTPAERSDRDDAVTPAAESAARSARAAQFAANAASKSAREADDSARRGVPPCSGSCGDALARCDHALSQIQRVIDAAGELDRRAH